MVKKIFLAVLLSISGLIGAQAQTDSTDLNFFSSEIVLETELDSILYDPETYELVQLEFSVSDTVAFEKVYIELKEITTNEVLFKKSYTVASLIAAGLLESWEVSIVFGNLLNTESYRVCVILQDYSGALGTTITKTLNP